jgi:hypothetical protein
MQTTNLEDLQGYDLVYGTLWLPSVRQHGDTIRLENITLIEAIDMLDDFTIKVIDMKKTKRFPDNDTPSLAYLLTNAIVNKSVDVETLANTLRTSHIPTFRGVRPVFVSDALSVIVVGRTVIYNQNWASVEVLDPSIQDTIRQVESQFIV